MEINGIWYARDCIKEINRVRPNGSYFEFSIWIIIGDDIRYQSLNFDTPEQAEQSRKGLIKQLEK